MRLFATLLSTLLLVLFVLSLLSAAPARYERIVFEAEDYQSMQGAGFRVEKYRDLSVKVSGDKVLAVSSLHGTEKPPTCTVSYNISIPRDGIYYLWARVQWMTEIYGDVNEPRFLDKLAIRVPGYEKVNWLIKGDGTYDALHWVCLPNAQNNKPQEIKLKKGTITLDIEARAAGIRIDQFILTTDVESQPQGAWRPTQSTGSTSQPTYRIFFEAEDYQSIEGDSFRIEVFQKDPSSAVSGNKVLVVPSLQPGEKLPPGSVSYRVGIPRDGFYYLWARTRWMLKTDADEKIISGNSFTVVIPGYEKEHLVIGGDMTYDVLHWVCLSKAENGKDKPREIWLKKGITDLKLEARATGIRIDQFILTTDAAFQPVGVYPNKPDQGKQ